MTDQGTVKLPLSLNILFCQLINGWPLHGDPASWSAYRLAWWFWPRNSTAPAQPVPQQPSKWQKAFELCPAVFHTWLRGSQYGCRPDTWKRHGTQAVYANNKAIYKLMTTVQHPVSQLKVFLWCRTCQKHCQHQASTETVAALLQQIRRYTRWD